MHTIDSRLADLYRLSEEIQIDRRQPPYVLNLANLRVNRVTPLPAPTGVAIWANVANSGTRESGDFWMMTRIGRNGVLDRPIWQRVASMAPGIAQDLLMTTLEDVAGMGICATVVADPPTYKRPYGEIFESNEQDNLLQVCFFVPFEEEDIPDPGDFEAGP